jgi:hypothetical protein
MLLCFRVARDIGCTVAELADRLSWAELLHWVAFYTREEDLKLPPEKRVVRPGNKEEATKALDALFGGFAKPKGTK